MVDDLGERFRDLFGDLGSVRGAQGERQAGVPVAVPAGDRILLQVVADRAGVLAGPRAALPVTVARLKHRHLGDRLSLPDAGVDPFGLEAVELEIAFTVVCNSADEPDFAT